LSIYLDHNACTPVDARVLERFNQVERVCPANPGSVHRAGRAAAAALERARDAVARAFAADSEQVVFVSGGTEANNIAVCCQGDPTLPVLLAPLEHPSVVGPAEDRGALWWAVDASGRAVVHPPTTPVGLVCMVHAQNEIGTLQPVAEAAAVARRQNAPLHVDISQSLGRVPLTEVLASADTIAVSPHKVGGLRGLAVLIARRPQLLRPLLRGGSQERGLRPGTGSPALAAANALAIELALGEQVTRSQAMANARARFESALDPSVRRRRLGSGDALPNTVMLLFEGVDGRNLLPALDLAGVEASQGSACSSGSPEPPRVLSAMGLSEADARRCVRFSFDWRIEPDTAERAAAIVSDAVRKMQL